MSLETHGLRPGTFGVATVEVGGGAQVAVQVPEGVVPLGDLLDGTDTPSSLRGMLEDWDTWCDRIDRALAATDPPLRSVEEVSFLPPITDPSAIYCSGANYRDHVAEMRRDLAGETVPFHFLVPPAALTGHRQVVDAPAATEAKLDWEVELVAVVGRRADRISATDALRVIAGYTVANDISLRDWGPTGRHPFFGHRWLERKGRATFLPLGPAIVPTRFVPNVDALELGLTVNGAARQRSSTSEMIFPLEQQVAHLSGIVPLLPGDLILTGTPAGTAAAFGSYLADGDRMVAWVEGVGELMNTVKR